MAKLYPIGIQNFEILRNELGFPNKEVEEGFIRYLLPFYANIDNEQEPEHRKMASN